MAIISEGTLLTTENGYIKVAELLILNKAAEPK